MPRKNEPFLGLGYGWNDGENGWGPGYNEAVKVLALLTVGGIETIQNSPPMPVVGGKAYIVDTAPTEAWAGKAGNIAYWDVDTSVWLFVTPKAGFEVLVKSRGDNGEWYFYSSTGTWVRSPIISEAIEAHRKEQNAHGIDNVTGLQTELDKKANSTAIPDAIDAHRKELNAHGISNITNLQGELDKKLNKTDVPVPFEDTPFPDVWIPFNDSLRMIAGFGRDVMVEKDVVATYAYLERPTTATYIEKSKTLILANMNEPRFEKAGLLCEVQSTNIHTDSETTNCTGWGGSGEVKPTILDGLPALIYINTDGNWAAVPDGSPTLTIGETYTVSVFTDKSIAECAIRVIAGVNSNRVTLTKEVQLSQHLYRRYATFVSTKDPSYCHYYVNTVAGGCKVGCMQVERGSICSSYIKTNGSSVTRAADKITIPRLNNECVEWYSGSDNITPIIKGDTIEFSPPKGKTHLRNIRGFFARLTDAQRRGLR